MGKTPFLSLFAVCLLMPCVVSASDDKAGVSAQEPSPSPDGKQVVFAADYDSPTLIGTTIWICNIDGTGLRRLGGAPPLQVGAEPSWSPDGKTIAFSSVNANESYIWAAALDGTSLIQLTRHTLHNTQPTWSPDGTRLAFASDRGGSRNIWMMNADGSSPVRITTTANEDDHPSFSPDGSELVYSETLLTQVKYQITYAPTANLWTTKLDGTAPAQITTGNFNDWNPAWGKTGILFSTNRDITSMNWRLWIVNYDGSNLHELYSILSTSAAWTPSGNVLFLNENTVAGALSIISLLNTITGNVKPVTTMAGYTGSIDVLPTLFPKIIYTASTCAIPVAVFPVNASGSAISINQQTLRFGHSGVEKSLISCKANISDPNENGSADLLCSFATSKAKFTVGDTTAILRFSDTSGVPYEGRAAVVTTNVSNPSCP